MGTVLTNTGVPVNNVQIINVANNTGTVTDSLGKFQIVASLGDILEFHHLNYQSFFLPVVNFKNDTVVLQTKDFSIEEINVSSSSSNDYSQSSLEKMNQIPSFLGEKDIVKYLSTLPGVTSLSMLDEGIYVRGGNSSQNAYLVNGVAVSDPQHIGGILSIFDPFVLSNSKFFKSGFPAQYNGSLSSYIDMSPSKYTDNSFYGELNVGFLSSSVKTRFSPDKKKKSLLNMSFRKSYFQLIADLYNSSGEESIPSYSFSDFTISYDFPINSKWKVSAFGLVTNDQLPISVGNSFSYDLKWGSFSSNIKLDGILTKQTRISTVVGFNKNESMVGVLSEVDSKTDTQTDQLSILTRLNTNISDELQLVSGVGYVQKNYKYNQESENVANQNLTNEILYPFVEGVCFMGDSYILKAGINALVYFGENTEFFLSPRFKLSSVNPNVSWWLDYANTRQFEERMNVLTVQSPVDVWVPVGQNMPASCDQFSLGTKIRMSRNVKMKAALFHKKMRRIKDFDAYNRIDINQSIDKMISGTGNARGIELDVACNTSKIYSRVNYTYSEIRNQFADINQGEYFNPQYDVRHNMLVNLSGSISEKVKVNALWTYRSGVTATVPEGVAVAKDISKGSMEYIPVYKTRYNYRLPANHRLDVNFEYIKSLKHSVIKLNAGAYNVYNQQNSTFVYVAPENKDDYFIRFRLKSRVIFPFMPYVTLTYVL
ncbi:TonB-dependent receptor plug domain-containing protein [Plebeiibacterium marinum]|uniref:Plug domain-containing protein n=1 Tax=Plebeiibacterium marinum TaxID=2992111 RepID=A0AAE3MCV9_9BACT|nr:TonB-dependent receptor plug domain-containing protein [Plebeiobacterium marinum]MCW3805608.1 Plug domain-containing protein [Plebeiobacterium marinum]